MVMHAIMRLNISTVGRYLLFTRNEHYRGVTAVAAGRYELYSAARHRLGAAGPNPASGALSSYG